MTEPALVWRPLDLAVAPATCAVADCDRPAAYMRGPRLPLMRLPWHSYCEMHAVLYGVPRMRSRWRYGG